MTQQNSAEYIGSYKILHKIGEGGMALIYKALQPSLKRTVVLKKLKDPNREIINRFKNEALLSASFHHENLVAVYDFIYTKRSYYLVMEFVDGEDLRTIIDYMAPLPAALAGLLILEIVRGLEYTHARNIIHRDIKPGNILVSYSGDVKLIDFGVARDDISTRLTLTGMIVGTPAYMAPEQANGEPLSAVSDLFAIGILLYELLTGVKPFYGENNTEILSKIVQNKYIPPERINPKIPRTFRKIIKKAIHKDKKHRYQNATEMINDLEKAISWQTRSAKKTVISRFLKDLDKNKEYSETDSIKMQTFTAIPWWGWRSARIALVLVMFAMLGYQGFRFSKTQLGYAKLDLGEPGCSVQVDNGKVLSFEDKQVYLGPLLKGRHHLQVFKPRQAGLAYTDFQVVAAETTFFTVNRPLVSADSVAINISTFPKTAKVHINQQLIDNQLYDSILVPPGTYALELFADGFKARKETIEVSNGQAYTFHYILDPTE